jgi:hypothetical protein
MGAIESVGRTLVCLGLISFVGCAARPVITKEVYEDRNIWVRLEKNPYAGETAKAQPDAQGQKTQLTAPALAAWMKGFRVLTERGIVGMASGKSETEKAFVEQEILALTPYLAKALTLASSQERVAYCFAVDRNGNERYITTAWLFVQPPYLYYKLEEYRTLVRVPSLATATHEACLTKPQPGYKTEDRYFRLEYEPESFVAGYGAVEKYGSFMAGIIQNRRGEVVFNLSNILPEQRPSPPKVGSPPKEPSSSPGDLAGAAPQPRPLSVPAPATLPQPASAPASVPVSPTSTAAPMENAVRLKSAQAVPQVQPAAEEKKSKRQRRVKPKPAQAEVTKEVPSAAAPPALGPEFLR